MDQQYSKALHYIVPGQKREEGNVKYHDVKIQLINSGFRF